nr:unnamed protein product [Digitaria exilis]
MIPGSAVYRVVEAMAPLYTASVLGYASVRWLKAFSDEQCAGINHFAALYAAPVLIFHVVSTNDPYHMNERLIAADTLQKAVMLLALTAWALWAHFRRRRGGDGRLKWVVTNFSVASLPNTIVVGMPLLDGMYGSMSGGFLKQIVAMQFCVWYNVVIFLYEFIVLRESCAKMTPVLVTVAAENSDHILHIDENVGSIHAERGHPAENIEITEVAAASLTATDCASEDSITAVRKELSADRQAINGNNNKATEEGSAAVPPPAPATQQVPSVMRVLWMTGKKALSFPNTYASFLGLLWSLIAFRFGIKMPKIVDDSLFAIYTTTVGLSMFASDKIL